jgi:ubiquinone/menaquinone biosynthesis C-methylase UbiE
MPDAAFRLMALMFRIRGLFIRKDRVLDAFDIRPGQHIADYGCGPGSCIRKASELVGAEGRVYAVDIHELAVQAVEKLIRKKNLRNVTAMLAADGACPLEARSLDLIYALDMFHMVPDPETFLKELHRACKPGGVLFLDNGHQSREEARKKILASGVWEIVEENRRCMKCRPVP